MNSYRYEPSPSTDRTAPLRANEPTTFDPQTIALVRASYRMLPENKIELAREFYACLFEMAPATRAMFAADLEPQQDRLLRALLSAVNALDNPEVLKPQLAAWGALHRRKYGVTNDMYVYVGHALVRAVRNVIGVTETSVGSAWISVYEWLAATMIEGADSVDAGRLPPAAAPQAAPMLQPGHLEPAYPWPGSTHPARDPGVVRRGDRRRRWRGDPGLGAAHP